MAFDNRIAQYRAKELYEIGLVALPTWGQGKALQGTDHRALADSPPSYEEVISRDYSGGLSILPGTAHPAGGYVLAVDIDSGPVSWPAWPIGTLLVEEGTAPGKWHLLVRTKDRLEGRLNLWEKGKPEQNPVVEFKGAGETALRSWPTEPPGKPRGYQPRFLAPSPQGNEPLLELRQLAGGMTDFYRRVLGRQLTADSPHSRSRQVLEAPPEGLATIVEAALMDHGADLRPGGRDGWLTGFCPFHEDHRRSFSVNLLRGGWRCHSGCGNGSLVGLARKLGLDVSPFSGHEQADEANVGESGNAYTRFTDVWRETLHGRTDLSELAPEPDDEAWGIERELSTEIEHSFDTIYPKTVLGGTFIVDSWLHLLDPTVGPIHRDDFRTVARHFWDSYFPLDYGRLDCVQLAFAMKANPHHSMECQVIKQGWTNTDNVVYQNRLRLVHAIKKAREFIDAGGTLWVIDKPLEPESEKDLKKWREALEKRIRSHGVWWTDAEKAGWVPEDGAPWLQITWQDDDGRWWVSFMAGAPDGVRGRSTMKPLVGDPDPYAWLFHRFQRCSKPPSPLYRWAHPVRWHKAWKPNKARTGDWEIVGHRPVWDLTAQDVLDEAEAVKDGIKTWLASERELAARAPEVISHTRHFLLNEEDSPELGLLFLERINFQLTRKARARLDALFNRR